MIAGFTGSRKGMTTTQLSNLSRLLTSMAVISELHHGDCVGADDDAADISAGLGITTVSHPPSDGSLQAHHPSDIIKEPKPYLQRNRDIVDAATIIFAAPFGTERTRSGTWYTIRYARRQGVPVVML